MGGKSYECYIITPTIGQLTSKTGRSYCTSRDLSKQEKTELAAAWDEVEELLAETSHQQAEAKTCFEQYCEDNP